MLDEKLALQMRQAAGFRNVLVHDYVEVDDRIVMSRLDDLSDLDQFSRQIVSWLGASQDQAQNDHWTAVAAIADPAAARP